MPQYPHAVNFEKLESRTVKVIPQPLFRKFFKFYPYFVADKIQFRIEVSEKNTSSFGIYYLDEYFNDKKISTTKIVFKSREFQGSTIEREGDIKYTIRSSSQNPTEDVIFTARVINKDRFVMQYIASSFFAFIFGVLLGFLSGTINFLP